MHSTSPNPVPSTPASPIRATGRWLLLLLVLIGLGLSAWLLMGLARQHAKPAATAYRILEQSRSSTEVLLAVEMDPQTLKTEIEEAARQLLENAPWTAQRRIDFWLGPKGPFNPVYASVVLEPGQPNQPFRLFLHRH